jgi:hypothetical protein
VFELDSKPRQKRGVWDQLPIFRSPAPARSEPIMTPADKLLPEEQKVCAIPTNLIQSYAECMVCVGPAISTPRAIFFDLCVFGLTVATTPMPLPLLPLLLLLLVYVDVSSAVSAPVSS